MVIIMTKADTVPLSNDITDKLVVVNEEYFDEVYKEARYQLVKAIGGFGCNAGKGKEKRLHVKEVFPERNDGKKRTEYNLRRSDLLGEPTPECLAEYQELYGNIVVE